MSVTRHPSSGAGMTCRPPHQAGFVLMDVLVSILLFSVGVLALMALQTAMTRNQTEAKIRADASYLANELIGMMWGQHVDLSKFTTTDCTTVDLCKEWQAKVASALPNGEGKVEASEVVPDPASGAISADVTVTISWKSPSGDPHKFVTQTSIATNATTN